MQEIENINIHISVKDSEYIGRPVFIRIKESDGKDNLERLDKAIQALTKVRNDYQLSLDIPL